MLKSFRIFLVSVGLYFLGAIACFVYAEDVAGYFDKNSSYDIYIQGQDDNLPVLRDVEIIRLEEINRKTFLVVKPADFSFSPSEGYILFDAIVVILPNKKLKLQPTNTIKIQH